MSRNGRRDLWLALGVSLLAGLPYLAAGVSGDFEAAREQFVKARP